MNTTNLEFNKGKICVLYICCNIFRVRKIIGLLKKLFKTKDFNIILMKQACDKTMTFITRLTKKIASKNLCQFNIKIMFSILK